MKKSRLVRKKQEPFRKTQSWGIPIANKSTLSSKILDNDKAAKALEKIEENKKNNKTRLVTDKNKKNQLLDLKRKIKNNDNTFSTNSVQKYRFEISRETKDSILMQIKNKQPINQTCIEFMIQDQNFQKEVFTSPNLIENKIFIDFLRTNIEKMLADAEQDMKNKKVEKKFFDPDKVLKSEKRRQEVNLRPGVFKFKSGTLEIPKNIWVVVYSGGLPSLGKRSR